MFQKLVSHNEDLRRLVEKGYAVAFDGAHLIVRDIPYLDAAGALHWAAFVAKLVFVDDKRVVQDDHQVYFSGGVPHNMDGTSVQNLAGGAHSIALSDNAKDVVVQRSFSNKPRATGKFENFFDKIESYVALIAGPAMSRHGVSPYTYKIDQADQEPSVFKFQDTLTSRAEITELNRKFAEDSHIAHFDARSVGLVDQANQLAHLFDGKAEITATPDERESADGRLAVDAAAAFGARPSR